MAPREECESKAEESVLGEVDDQEYRRIWRNSEEEGRTEEAGTAAG